MTRMQLVTTSATLLRCFNIDKCKDKTIYILSVFNGKVLASKYNCPELFIYNERDNRSSTIMIDVIDGMFDAVWTPLGNIAYTTFKSGKVAVITEIGQVSTQYQLKKPIRLSVSYDNVIYVADFLAGVYQSTDDAMSWSLVFNLTDGANPIQAVKVATDFCDDFWTLVLYQDYTYLRVYCTQKDNPRANVTWINVHLPMKAGKPFDLEKSSLTYDGYSNIFLSDYWNKRVYLFSTNAQYSNRLLISSDHLQSPPTKITVDQECLLYVGQEQDLICLFRILNENKANYS